ncbi:MAG: hypothetical protein AB1397_07780 [bacterium]
MNNKIIQDDNCNMIKGALREMTEFELELNSLINKYSRENISNTPDFILGEYLQDCLQAYEKAVNLRDKWKT